MDLPAYPLFYIKKIQLGAHREHALFAKRDIPKGACIGFYSGTEYVHKTSLSKNEKDKLESEETEYGIDVAPRHRIIPFKNEKYITALERQSHPLAMMNEPRKGDSANVTMIVQDFLPSEIDMRNNQRNFEHALFLRGLAAFACSNISKHDELTWWYGTHYAPVRKRKGYDCGKECMKKCDSLRIRDNSIGVRLPKHDMLHLKKGIPAMWVFPIYTHARSEREDEFKKKKRKRNTEADYSDSD